jgi:hypothetical protein
MIKPLTSYRKTVQISGLKEIVGLKETGVESIQGR